MAIILFLLSQSEALAPSNILLFANHLYVQEDYSTALNEYRRYIFLSDSSKESANGRILDCLIKLHRYDEAMTETEKIDDLSKRNYTKGRLHFLKGQYDSSRTYLATISIPYDVEARKIVGLGYAHEFNFNEAGKYLELTKPYPRYRSPALGGILAFFPGGGHFYSGRVSDGIYSLCVVSMASVLSYYYHDRGEDLKFGIALGAAIFFYVGSIYGGINAARNYNYYQNESYLQGILDENK